MTDTLKSAYTIRELAAELNLSPRSLQRTLAAGGVKCGRGRKVWIGSLRKHMPDLLDAWAEIRHQRALSQMRRGVAEQ